MTGYNSNDKKQVKNMIDPNNKLIVKCREMICLIRTNQSDQ